MIRLFYDNIYSCGFFIKKLLSIFFVCTFAMWIDNVKNAITFVYLLVRRHCGEPQNRQLNENK
ncbi:hypothetical protein B0A77_10805 [Flavobacterium branchiophilum]|uniref:Uncharacterized protein n=1 Tax=Flavobacterium branchiophilum TaxID=55197 RepID=A0A2H3KAA6_9FLAO|nr:hypothetical protein B0A77_10805 [Flavobacterium branchiophilum]